MDEPNTTDRHQQNPDESREKLVPRTPTGGDEECHSDCPKEDEQAANKQEKKRSKHFRKSLAFCYKLKRVSPDRTVELLLAFVVIAFSAVQLAVTILNNRAQLEESINNFRDDQRPWVGFQSPICEGCTETAEPLKKLGPMHFYQKQYLTISDLSSLAINTGKTPASNVQVHHTIVALSADAPIPTWDSFTRQWAAQTENAKTTAPSGAQQVYDKYASDIRGASDPEFDLPPTVTHIVHLAQMPTMPYWRDAFGKEQLVIYVLGEIAYYDQITKQHHVTTLCLTDKNWLGGTSAFTYCQTGNTMN